MKPKAWHWILGLSGIAFVAYRVYKSYAGEPTVTGIVSSGAAAAGPRKMANGYTYADYSNLLLNTIYGSGAVLPPWMKNTDEAYLIRLLNGILESEYPELNKVYQALKGEKPGWFDGYRRDVTLIGDVKDTLNMSELSQLTTLWAYI